MAKAKPVDYASLGYVPFHPHNGMWHKFNHVDPAVQVVIDEGELASAIQRRTNYADNASERQNTDNVLVCKYDNKMYVDMLNDALTGCFLHVGKLCKLLPVDFDGSGIKFNITAKWNYDFNTFQLLAQGIYTYIVLSVVRTWLMNRNSQMFQAADAEFGQCVERLDSLVNWRIRPERRRVDPLL